MGLGRRNCAERSSRSGASPSGASAAMSSAASPATAPPSFVATFIQQAATSDSLGRSAPGDREPRADPVGSGQPTENRTEASATRRS